MIGIWKNMHGSIDKRLEVKNPIFVAELNGDDSLITVTVVNPALAYAGIPPLPIHKNQKP